MAYDRSRFGVELDVNAAERSRTTATMPVLRGDEMPRAHRIALLGDFSGRATRDAAAPGEIARRTPVIVDRDSVDDAIARIGPRLALDGAEGVATVTFDALDDFHPDRLYDRLPVFRALRDAKARGALPPSLLRGAAAGSARETPPARSPGNVLDAILGGEPLPPVAPTAVSSSVESDTSLAEFVRRAVAPVVVPEIPADQRDNETRIDAAIAAQMRTLLHRPAFQALESLWRGVDLLVRRLETDERLTVELIDVSQAELAADLASDAERSGIARLLSNAASAAANDDPWSLLVGLYDFGSSDADLALLEQMASVARMTGAPFVSAAAPRLAGATSFAEVPDSDDWSDAIIAAWEAVRESPDASWVGLVTPRLLLRLPYGVRTDACDLFAFEEMSERPAHDDYLWGNGALVVALASGESFAAPEYASSPSVHREIGGLPLHVYLDRGEPRATPCTEVGLSDRAVDRLLDRGLMPLAWRRDSDSAVLVRLQSVASPVTPLAGGR